MLQSFRPTLCHIPVSISCFLHMPLLYQLKRRTMSNCQFLRSQMLSLSLQAWWLSVILDMGNTWPAVWCTEEMLFQRMSMLLWLLSKAKGLFSLLTGEKIHNWKKKKTTNGRVKDTRASFSLVVLNFSLLFLFFQCLIVWNLKLTFSHCLTYH